MTDRPGSSGLPNAGTAYLPYKNFVDAARRAAELVVRAQNPGVVLVRNRMPHDLAYIRDMERLLKAARTEHVLAGRMLDDLDAAVAQHRHTRDLPTLEEEQTE